MFLLFVFGSTLFFFSVDCHIFSLSLLVLKYLSTGLLRVKQLGCLRRCATETSKGGGGIEIEYVFDAVYL